MKLDEKDKQILNLLQQDARLNAKQLAFEVGLSLTPTYERIKRIEQAGYINRNVALLDQRKIGKSLTVFCTISMNQHAKSVIENLEKKMLALEEVMECYHIAGSFDYLVKLVVEDMSEYQNFIKNKLTLIEDIGMVQSSFVMTTVKHETAFHLK